VGSELRVDVWSKERYAVDFENMFSGLGVQVIQIHPHNRKPENLLTLNQSTSTLSLEINYVTQGVCPRISDTHPGI